MGRIILNSIGLQSKEGCKQIYETIQEEKLAEKTMFLVSYTPYGVDELVVNNCVEILGFKRENLYLSANGIPKDVIPDFIWVTEGNTFEVLKYMRDNALVDYIKALMKKGNTTYIGSSAGAAIAGSDIMLCKDFDGNSVGMIDFTALGLFEGTIIPHYEPEYLENYIKNTEEHIIRRYKKIYSVSDEEVLVM